MKEIILTLLTYEGRMYAILAIGFFSGFTLVALYCLCYTSKLRQENNELRSLLGRNVKF
jgi:hypothetical protein